MASVKQATLEAQDENVQLTAREASEVTLHNGKKVKVGYILPDTQDKINYLNVKYERAKRDLVRDETAHGAYDNNTPQSGYDNYKANRCTREHFAKCAAAILLNNYFGLKYLWWAKWRLLYHFSGWNGDDYLKVILEAKKKAQEQQYYLAMGLLMGMTTTWTTMTKKEAEEYHHELSLAREAQSLKNTQD